MSKNLNTSAFATGVNSKGVEKGKAQPYLTVTGGVKQRVGRFVTKQVSRNSTPLAPIPPMRSVS